MNVWISNLHMGNVKKKQTVNKIGVWGENLHCEHTWSE